MSRNLEHILLNIFEKYLLKYFYIFVLSLSLDTENSKLKFISKRNISYVI